LDKKTAVNPLRKKWSPFWGVFSCFGGGIKKKISMCTLFLARPIKMIFMEKQAQAHTFWANKISFEKRVKKGTYRNFCKICQKLKKSQFFVKS